MVERLKRLLLVVAGFFQKASAQKPTIKPLKSDAESAEKAGKWYFKRNILDRLDEYFDDVAMLKKCDPQAYRQCAKIGAVLQSPNAELLNTANLHKVGKKIPAFGAAFLGHTHRAPEEANDYIPVSFLCFQKWEKPYPGVAKADGTVYSVIFFYIDTVEGKKFNWPLQFYVCVDGEGNVRPLKQKMTEYQKLPGRNEGGNHVPKTAWHYPKALRDLYKDKSDLRRQEETLQHYAATMFTLGVQLYYNASLDIKVRVKKKNKVAAFSIDMLRTPYFFADRDAVVTTGGKKRKVFHIVRTHERTLSSGKKTYIRSHFRGARKFVWNGYDVTITMPGYHHADLLDFHGGAIDAPSDEPIPKGLMTDKEATRKFVEALDA